MNLVVKVLASVLIIGALCQAKKHDPGSSKLEWWKSAVIYQIYPKSFKDTDNDGIGDLRGIISKLDYLSYIGVNAIWLNSIYPSGGKDGGYDVTSYMDVDPLYGSMDDFDELVEELHQRGMYIILDFIPNHTSDKHKWFVESSKNNFANNTFKDYYVWAQSEDYSKPPNNWLSEYEDSAWEFSENRKEWYLHQFFREQPELNHRSELVQKEMKQIIKFWLKEKQVDGLRVDSLKYLYEDAHLQDEPIKNDRYVDSNDLKYSDLHHIRTSNQKESFETITKWREYADEISAETGRDKVIISDVFDKPGVVTKYCNYNGKPGASFPFNFQLIQLNNYSIDEEGILQPNILMDLIDPWIQNIGYNCWSNWVIGNHDNSRVASRLGAEYINMANALNLLLGGTTTTYYGEELGMEDLPKKSLNFEDAQDEKGKKQGPELFWVYSRDYQRTPMQWSSRTSTAGFTNVSGVKPWLPINSNYKHLNVEKQLKNKKSHLRIFKDLTKLRQEPSFLTGMFKFALINKEIFSFIRHERGYNGYLVAMNLGERDLLVNFHYSDLLPKRAEIVYFFASTHEDNEKLESRFRAGTFVSTKKVPLKAKSVIILSFEDQKHCHKNSNKINEDSEEITPSTNSTLPQ